MSLGWLSLGPACVTLLAAILTKRIIPSLVLGLLAGCVLLTGSLPWGVVKASETVAGALAEADSVYIVLFLFLFGALAEIFKLSGGIKGFSRLAENYARNERGALLAVWAVTPFTFLDCCFHAIATGTIAKPIVRNTGGSAEKLAAVINITSSQLIVLLPLATTYVGYIVGVVAAAMTRAGIAGSPYSVFLRSIPFNFYSLGMVLLGLLLAFSGIDFGKWRIGARESTAGGVHGSHEAHEECEFEERAAPRPLNLFLPLVFLVSLMLFLFWLTGKGPGRSFATALAQAEFEKSIFIATFATLMATAIFYAIQRIPMAEMESHFLSGGAELIPPIVVLILSWSLAAVTEELGFHTFIGRTLAASLPRWSVPTAVFLLGAGTSYFIGSSWATWALLMPLGLPLAVKAGISLPLMLGAVLAGGSVGDSVSPLGETPVLTATVTEISVVEHIRTILPYALIVIIVSVALYVICGFLA